MKNRTLKLFFNIKSVPNYGNDMAIISSSLMPIWDLKYIYRILLKRIYDK
jgi:hypothetical protein